MNFAADSNPLSTPAAHGLFAGRRAVIVEEDAALAAELEALLAGDGVTTLRVAGQQDVGAALRDFDPHTCLVDLDLAGGRGPALVELFAGLFPDARSIVLTDDPADPALLAALGRHAVEPLAKPIRPAALSGAVARCCRAHDESRERSALGRALAEARQAASALLSIASHELRTPLNAIIGFSQLLEQADGPEPALVREYAQTIHHSGIGLLGVIDDMLCFAALDAGTQQAAAEPVDLVATIDAALAGIGPLAAAAGVALSRRLPPRLPGLSGDRRLLGKALAALLDNAVRFAARRGGRAGVAARLADSGGLLLQLADNGPGIESDRLARLARPFAVGDDAYARSHNGIGLGIALARKVAELHAGRLEIRSRPNTGTVVTLSFPEARLLR